MCREMSCHMPDTDVARDALIREHVALAHSIAGQIYRRFEGRTTVSLADLVQSGLLGLVAAGRSYRTGGVVSFGAFAQHRIRGEILDSLRKVDPVPRRLRTWARRTEAASAALAGTLGRAPTESEICASVGTAPEEAQRRRTALACALRHLQAEGPARDLADLPAGAEMRPDVMLERREARRLVAVAMRRLPARSRAVVHLYYQQRLTLKEIGRLFHLQESRVSQLRRLALQQMADRLSAWGVRSSSDI
jgi:RNA polymerase sigma factor FliA